MRAAAAVTVLGLAVATGVPAVWALTRPEAAAGVPVLAAVATAGPSAAPESPAAPAAPPVPARDAGPAPLPQVPAPARLRIDALGLDAPVDPVGVAGDGQMALPGDVTRVGWYRFGPAPGAPGNAVLAGHVDDAEQGLGALAPLRGIDAGTEVELTDAAGTTSRWRVVSRELIDKQVLPLGAIFAREGPPRLVLVTCGGPFLRELASYRDNVVVVAEAAP